MTFVLSVHPNIYIFLILDYLLLLDISDMILSQENHILLCVILENVWEMFENN